MKLIISEILDSIDSMHLEQRMNVDGSVTNEIHMKIKERPNMMRLLIEAIDEDTGAFQGSIGISFDKNNKIKAIRN